jgi:hypothetical protein
VTTANATAPRVRYLDRWDDRLIFAVAAPLVLWGAASVFMLAWACGIEPWIAWVPALATSGVMLSSTRIAMRHGIPAHIKQWATYLAVFAVFAEIIVAGLQHSLPQTLQPPAGVMFAIGCLPTLMGAATIKVWSAAKAEQAAANAAAEHAQAQTAALAEQLRLQAAADAQTREAELTHQRQLAALAQQTAQAEQAKAAAARQVAEALKAPAAPQRPHLVPPPSKPAASPKRDAALAWLVEQARAGRDLDSIPAAEVDRAINAKAYARKHLKTWIADVRAYVAKGVA